jgi:hypothetical protein
MGRINPDLLSDLLREDLGPIDEVMLTSDMTIDAARRLWLSNSFLKKFEDRESNDAHDLAIAKFLSYNQKCASFVLQPKRLFDEELIGGVRTVLDDWLHPNGVPAGLFDFTVEAELGSGSSVETDTTAFYTKLFDSGLTTANEDLRRLYRDFAALNPTWLAAEEARYTNHGNRAVEGSKITTVPKQFDIKRTICVEPVLEMFFQRGIGNFLERVMKKRLGVSLESQPDLNREFARVGSLTGAFGTIDLRSASDCISTTLIESLFPRYFVDWLKRTRCKTATLPDGSRVELSMISSMGNGYTFALQTMLFASIVVTCYRLKGHKPSFRKKRGLNPEGTVFGANCGVFGDDIVVRSDTYDLVVHALTLFGFEVNDGKSFNSGDFRESCGHDYFRGVNIRGVYIKSLSTEQDCFSAVNRLIRWGVIAGVPLDLTVSYLLGNVSFMPIPFRDGDDEGVKVPFSHSRITYYSIDTRNPLYRARVSLPNSIPVPESAEQLSEKAYQNLPCRLAYNGSGILLSLVGGFVRDGRITVRSERKRSKVRQRSVPFWDYVPTAEGVHLRDAAWSAAVANQFDRIGYPDVML